MIWRCDILMATDYYPFGMAIPEHQWYTGSDSSNYRYGFNGMEKDNEAKGPGNSLDFGARIYDSRLGRWLSVDPLFDHPKNISHSPYIFGVNSPIIIIDKDGELWWVAVGALIGGGATAIKLAINGELNFKDGAWKKTVSRIALGAATGAAIAAFPASGLGAGGALLSTQAVVSSFGAGLTSAGSNLLDQGIDKYFNGEKVFDLKSYNYTSAAFSGLISTLTFGGGAVFGNKLALGNRSFLWKSFNDHAELYGVLAGSIADVLISFIDGGIEKYNKETKVETKEIWLPELIVKPDGSKSREYIFPEDDNQRPQNIPVLDSGRIDGGKKNTSKYKNSQNYKSELGY